ncbi:MAG: class I SAM-dependent methyltransferase [Pyrinomonadaceae bacterium]|nr:class I SAM-dependent methyltransferase [Pyrinomonadaceae bacterium]
MSKTEKELAFLRDLYIETDWTERFTNLFDDHYKFSDEEKILYVNAGAGNHALALREKLDDEVEIFGVSESRELLTIARAKADAIQANVDFSIAFPEQKYDAVMADATFVKPHELKGFLAHLANFSDKQVAVFLPSAGSFGEVFSLLWETLLNLEMLDKAAEIERLITEIPTISKIKETAENLGLTKVETMAKSEFFEYDNGAAFVNSPLLEDFLFPNWFDFLNETEMEKVKNKLVQTIDDDALEMSSSFSVKATLLVGEKQN